MKRCCFCGVTDSWPFLRAPIAWIGGDTPACSTECLKKHRLRQAVEPANHYVVADENTERVIVVDQVQWAAEYRRTESA
jgi:hypothetical protein